MSVGMQRAESQNAEVPIAELKSASQTVDTNTIKAPEGDQ